MMSVLWSVNVNVINDETEMTNSQSGLEKVSDGLGMVNVVDREMVDVALYH